MSYLDVPRLHFAGLFYTGPSTINNLTQNYIPATPLTLPGQPTMLDPNAVLWNRNGVAQWWLDQCSVLSAVGPTGSAITSSSTDRVIGASVQSPSPTTPMSDSASGFYDIAKMVDLDPDQQGRSALYGVRISVKLANGAGFQGLLTVAELRPVESAHLRNGRKLGSRRQLDGNAAERRLGRRPFVIAAAHRVEGGGDRRTRGQAHRRSPSEQSRQHLHLRRHVLLRTRSRFHRTGARRRAFASRAGTMRRTSTR